MKGPNMALVFSLSTLMFLITGTETSKSLSQGPDLKQVIQVDSGKDAVLECSVNFNGISPGNVNIEKVVWWRLDQNGLHKGGPVFIYNLSNQQSSNPRMPLSPKYLLPMPPANDKYKVVSLLVKETQPEDEGLYRCVVNTNSGNTNCNFMLNVTELQYETSTEKEIPKNSYMSVAAVCVAVGSLAIGLLLLKLFQARRLRQGEHPGSCPLGHTVAKCFKMLFSSSPFQTASFHFMPSEHDPAFQSPQRGMQSSGKISRVLSVLAKCQDDAVE
ncbi:uncharacterized protein LOC121842882 isoform X2 [Oncorhynchus tshawytscha]|uniref:uncharacterized protein LOC121842882 isoform X2 n=1 Tax=Oncorhynchus tshawytscha TaxID=74940 RepID=UPI001C3E15ED|nr:uncharacterized protein LOC121842882 isoform X2 [Oncorhynchus tshawytscha]